VDFLVAKVGLVGNLRNRGIKVPEELLQFDASVPEIANKSNLGN
jgi:hypothetical protein